MKNKKKNIVFVLLLLIVGLSVGYALLSTNLKINGSSKIKGSSWDIHFDNLVVNSDSVELSTGDVPATISTSTTEVSYIVTLNKPGDFYEFTVDAVNAGSVDGMIESVTSKLNDAVITTLPVYLDYSVSYSDGVPLQSNQILKAGDSETYKVRVEFKKDIENNELPSDAQTLTFNFEVVYVQADDNAVKVLHPESFADDDWDIVINTLKTGNISPYEVGDEKEVDLGTFGVHKLRIANSTTPEECSTEGFSQTACGIVLEFADIINTHEMNSTDTNVGGWPASSMREYVNSDIYNALPMVIKNAICDTTVVSSHGVGSTVFETNFTSVDKLYLLSTHEVWEDVDGDTRKGINRDTSYYNTRQLDYYKNLNITSSNYSGAIKMKETSNSYWWLRSAYFNNFSDFYFVYNAGNCMVRKADFINYGVSPAFRIA